MFYGKLKIMGYKELYQKGTRVILRSMKNEPNKDMVEGLKGTVQFVDDVGNIHIKWDNGSSLSLIPEVDEFSIIKED